MDGNHDLFLSAALHSAIVEVNETGTEATAVTLESVSTAGMSGHFYANHPFIFLIRENGSGSILFMGRIVDPSKL